MNSSRMPREPAPSLSLRRRTQARILAMQSLCLFDSLGEDFERQVGEFLNDPANYEDLGFDEPPSLALLGFARTLAEGAHAHRTEADELLTANVTQWSIARMAPVDRNILRLGLYELLHHPETPPQVILNEAVDLARLFGGNDSPSFVNGVLDSIWQQVRGKQRDGGTAEATSGA